MTRCQGQPGQIYLLHQQLGVALRWRGHGFRFIAKDGQKIEIELIESYRWPDSIHIVSPGYLKKTPILARPIGNIPFANNAVAASELETSMARGAREARSEERRVGKECRL